MPRAKKPAERSSMMTVLVIDVAVSIAKIRGLERPPGEITACRSPIHSRDRMMMSPMKASMLWWETLSFCFKFNAWEKDDSLPYLFAGKGRIAPVEVMLIGVWGVYVKKSVDGSGGVWHEREELHSCDTESFSNGCQTRFESLLLFFFLAFSEIPRRALFNIDVKLRDKSEDEFKTFLIVECVVVCFCRFRKVFCGVLDILFRGFLCVYMTDTSVAVAVYHVCPATDKIA